MNYFVLVRYETGGEWHEITREFSDYEKAVQYAEYEYGREADNISVCLYELKKSYN